MIFLKDISKIYYGKGMETIALQNISLTIKQGEFVAIIGKSGCGKTSLLNILGCMDNYTEGGYFFEKTEVKDLKGNALAKFRNKNIGYIFQAFHLIPELNSLENVSVPLGYGGIGAKERRRRALIALDRVGMADRYKHRPGELSGGQQQRVAIARAIVGNPKLILADEPTGNLDEKNAQDILSLLIELNKEGSTIIMVTHDMSIASQTNRVIKIVDGRVV